MAWRRFDKSGSRQASQSRKLAKTTKSVCDLLLPKEKQQQQQQQQRQQQDSVQGHAVKSQMSQLALLSNQSLIDRNIACVRAASSESESQSQSRR